MIIPSQFQHYLATRSSKLIHYPLYSTPRMQFNLQTSTVVQNSFSVELFMSLASLLKKLITKNQMINIL